jgi:hypothetical protein
MAEETMKTLVETIKDHPNYWGAYYRLLIEIVEKIKKEPYHFIMKMKELPYDDFERVYRELVDFPGLPHEVNEELKIEYNIRNASKRN